MKRTTAKKMVSAGKRKARPKREGGQTDNANASRHGVYKDERFA